MEYSTNLQLQIQPLFDQCHYDPCMEMRLYDSPKWYVLVITYIYQSHALNKNMEICHIDPKPLQKKLEIKGAYLY